MCVYNTQLGCQVYFSECYGNICQTSLVNTIEQARSQCSVVGFLCFFGGVVGVRIVLLLVIVMEFGYPTLRLLLMGCVDVEGSFRHAKLVS
jgi:hypothetical protein